MTLDTNPLVKNIQQALAIVARRFGIAIVDIRGSSKVRRHTSARAVFCWVMRRRGYSYPKIAGMVWRDHTTVLLLLRSHPLDVYGREVEQCEQLIEEANNEDPAEIERRIAEVRAEKERRLRQRDWQNFTNETREPRVLRVCI